MRVRITSQCTFCPDHRPAGTWGTQFEPTGAGQSCAHWGIEQHGRAEPNGEDTLGDEDRGTLVTPAYAWDNEVTISTNQAPVHSPLPLIFPTWIKFTISEWWQIMPVERLFLGN